MTTQTPAAAPPCCRCNPLVCAADDTGEHCADQACGVCLHGCPALTDDLCCLLRPATEPTP
ncbi:hypothetical protein [Micrococcus luteus]|uniref:hypothetical protein n=1 Tax=Micrococcus luteus TaxID=1270 RepID=UPI003322D1C4